MAGLQRRRSSMNLLKLDIAAAQKQAQEYLQQKSESKLSLAPQNGINFDVLSKQGKTDCKMEVGGEKLPKIAEH